MADVLQWQRQAVPVVLATYDECLKEGSFTHFAIARNASFFIPKYFVVRQGKDYTTSCARIQRAVEVLRSYFHDCDFDPEEEDALEAIQDAW
jgi:hypothetical protein